jgi:hypothetical protein
MLDTGTPVYLFGLGDGIDFKGDANDVNSFRWESVSLPSAGTADPADRQETCCDDHDLLAWKSCNLEAASPRVHCATYYEPKDRPPEADSSNRFDAGQLAAPPMLMWQHRQGV